MITEINNSWITLTEQFKGVDVQRAFGGLHAMVGEPSNDKSVVTGCRVFYWERELYPNGDVIKTSLKSYTLTDLAETVNDAEGWKMEAKLVLTGFVQSLGDPYIIGPARITLADAEVLMLGAPEGYELHKETRPHVQL